MRGETNAPESRSSQAFDYDRTVALSDGVFAIALTLLVLTISFPELSGPNTHRLVTELQHRTSQVYSYGLSFAVLAYLWLRHHAFFREINRIDLRISVLNLTYLALVAFLPYPTRLLGSYGDQRVSVAVYATNILLISLVASLMRYYAVKSGFTKPLSPAAWRRQLAAPAVFGISIPIALLAGTKAATWSWLLLLLVPFLERARATAGGRRSG